MSELAIISKQEPQLTKKDLDDWLMGSDTKLTDKQKAMFYQVALAFQLNPVKREIYAIAYGNNFNIITGYEVYLKRAERTEKLEYWKADVVKVDNEWIGRCTVKRTDRTEPTTIEAWFNEYNQNNAIWKSKPRTMIRKVAIAQAFRMSFPDELGGMPYTSDEMGAIEAEVVPEKIKTMGDSLKKSRSSHHEALSKPSAESETSPAPLKPTLAERIEKAVDACDGIGYSKSDIEGWLKKPYDEWDEADLKKLGTWYKEELAQIKAHEQEETA